MLDVAGNPVGMSYEVPSVTHIIGEVLSKGGGLVGWAYNTAVAGMHDLSRTYDLKSYTEPQVKALMKEHGHTVWAKRDAAADRGTKAHDILEVAFKESMDTAVEKMRDTLSDDPERLGHALGALKWVTEYDPEPEYVEHIAVSFPHWFAGTLDLIWKSKGPVTFSDGVTTLHPMRVMTDLKTSKKVYDSHGIQMSFYDIAMTAIGAESEAAAVLRTFPVLDGDDVAGDYEFVQVPFQHRSAELIRELYRELKGE